MLRRVVGLLIAMVAASLSGATPTAAAAPAMPMATYIYDGHHGSADTTQNATERGPPATYDHASTHIAADFESRGASARSLPQFTTYATPTPPSQAASARTTSGQQVVVADGHLSSLKPCGVAAKSGDALLSTGASGAGRRLPMNMQTVCETACKYDIDISDVTIKINKGRAGYAGSTGPDGTITLTRSAFTNEEQLARTLFHERFHVDQIRGGMGYPTSRAAAGPWEDAAVAAESSWWASR